MIAQPLYLTLLATLLTLVVSIVWPRGAWIDPLLPVFFLLGFVLKEGILIYLVLVLSFIVDLVFGLPLGAMSLFYLPLYYLGVKSGRSMNIRNRTQLFMVTMVAVSISFGSWNLFHLLLHSSAVYPYSYLSFAVGSIAVIALWKP